MNVLGSEVFDYDLPTDRIAQFPLVERDRAKMIVAHAGTSTIHHAHVSDLPELIPRGSILIMNNSRVIPARLVATKRTGGRVELFLCEPTNNLTHTIALSSQESSEWICLIGGRHVHIGTTLLIEHGGVRVEAVVRTREENKATVEFHWNTHESFASVLERVGATPLPPYMKRESQQSDKTRYQTVYASADGSVAAPTAGLHLTTPVLDQLKSAQVSTCELTLHVGLGTFEPMKSSVIADHRMHGEHASVTRQSLMQLHDHCSRISDTARTVCVGTTSLRTVESLYWLGHTLLTKRHAEDHYSVPQWIWRDAETSASEHTPAECFNAILDEMIARDVDELRFSTSLMIAPSYNFRVCDTLLTNFHQPKSTLLVLVSAFSGVDTVRRVYDEALRNDYRFLSYGDCSLLFR